VDSLGPVMVLAVMLYGLFSFQDLAADSLVSKLLTYQKIWDSKAWSDLPGAGGEKCSADATVSTCPRFRLIGIALLNMLRRKGFDPDIAAQAAKILHESCRTWAGEGR